MFDACPGIRFRDSGDHDGDTGIGLFIDLGPPEQGEWFGKALKAESLGADVARNTAARSRRVKIAERVRNSESGWCR